jgi:hypothetical protein
MVRRAKTLAMRRVITAVPLRFKRFDRRFIPASPLLRSAGKPCTNRASWGVAKW